MVAALAHLLEGVDLVDYELYLPSLDSRWLLGSIWSLNLLCEALLLGRGPSANRIDIEQSDTSPQILQRDFLTAAAPSTTGDSILERGCHAAPSSSSLGPSETALAKLGQMVPAVAWYLGALNVDGPAAGAAVVERFRIALRKGACNALEQGSGLYVMKHC